MAFLVTKSEGVGLIVRAISFQDFQPMWSLSTNVTDGRTDGRTDDMQSQCHYCASRGKKMIKKAGKRLRRRRTPEMAGFVLLNIYISISGCRNCYDIIYISVACLDARAVTTKALVYTFAEHVLSYVIQFDNDNRSSTGITASNTSIN